MAIRVLRLIEYVYENEERAASDMARWTHAHRDTTMVMKSATLPFESVVWEKRPPTLSEGEHNRRFAGVTDIDTLTDEQYESIYHRPRPR